MKLAMDNYTSGFRVNKKNNKSIYWAVIFAFVYLFAIPGVCFSGPEFKTAIVVSKKIRPYIHVADGITNTTGEALGRMDVFFLSPQDNTQIRAKLNTGQYDLVTAIGPEAAALVWKIGIPIQKLYVAVLDPGSLPELDDGACGISLRIPVSVQLTRIAQTFYSIKKIGVIFDPRHNQWFFEQALLAGVAHGIDIIALPVNSKTRIAGLLKENRRLDAIWMIPDPTVISEKIIHYVIKQGIYNKMGVIGYNSFFTRSGAVFSFEFDYDALGRQSGEQMITYLTTGRCSKETPVFKIIVNQKIADKIGIRVKE